MSDSPHIEDLKDCVRHFHRLGSALALLGWDQETTMPKGGAAVRASAIGELTKVLLLAPSVGWPLAAWILSGRIRGPDAAVTMPRVIARMMPRSTRSRRACVPTRIWAGSRPSKIRQGRADSCSVATFAQDRRR